MREIKFRGKREDTGEWVYGDLIHRQIWWEALLVIRVQDDGFDAYEEYKVIPETVGQYTGLKDMNGAEIYEGDIVEYYHDWEVRPRKEMRIVEFIKGGFTPMSWLEGGYGYFTSYPSKTYHKIVGNVHDNPELLEEEKK